MLRFMLSKPKPVSVFLILMLIISLTACGSPAANSSGTSPNTESKADSAAQSGNKQDTAAAATSDPLGKYDPPIEITVIGMIGSDYKYLDGESFENNAWIQAYEKELGIKLKYKWYTVPAQYDQKLSLSIASKDLPDIMLINNPNDLNILESNDQLADLTDAYNQYASPSLKSVLEFEPKAFNLLHYNGKLVATGMPNNIYEGIPHLWIRNDWLRNVGLPAPKTMDDVLKIAEAFTTQDPDKNGKSDTFGLGMYKDIIGGAFSDLTGFFNGYHAYPKIWIKDASGNLAYGSIQPEMKNALQILQDMYKKGWIDKEFGLKDGGKASEMTTGGKVGMEFGAWWNGAWPLADSMVKDPKADWQSYPIVSSDSNPVLGSTNGGLNSYYVVNKNFKHPEALIKLQNFFLMTQQPDKVEQYQYLFGGTPDNKRQSEGQALAFGPLFIVDKNYKLATALSDAVSKKDPSALDQSTKPSYDAAMKWVNSRDLSDPQNFIQYITFGAGDISAQAGVIGKYMRDKAYMLNEFAGSPTPTMVEKKAVLDKLEAETMVRIIMGNSIDEFDKFVADWKKLGGDDITKEVNDWHSMYK